MTPTITAIKREATRVFGSCESVLLVRVGAGWLCEARVTATSRVSVASFLRVGALRDMLALLGALEARR